MVDSRFNLLFKILWLASIVVVTYLSLSSRIDFPVKVQHIDKLYHSLAYLWLAALPFIGFQHSRIALSGAILMLPFGILMEYAQGAMAHGRFFSFGDMIANGIGVFLGVGLGLYIKYRFFSNYKS